MRQFFLSGFCLLTIIHSGARAQESNAYQLSLESAILFALNENPDINISKERTNQQAFNIDRAKSVFYPQVTFNAIYGPEYNNPGSLSSVVPNSAEQSTAGPSFDASLTANQFIYDGRASQSEYQRQKELKRSAEINETITINDVLTDTIESYMNILSLQMTMNDSDIFLTRMKELEKIVILQTEAGAENKAIQNYVQSRVSFAESQYENIVASYSGAVTRLEYLVGDLPDFQVLEPSPIKIMHKDMQNYVEIALNNNNDIRLQNSDINVLKEAENREQGTRYPTVNLIAELATTNDVGGDVGSKDFAAAQVQFNYKIFDGFARDAAIGDAKSKIAEAQYLKEKIAKETKQQTKLLYNQIIAIQNDLQITAEEIDSSRKLQVLSQQQFELGEGNLINLIEGEERLNSAIIKQNQLRRDLLLNTYQLIRIAGLMDKQIFCKSC